LRTLWSDGFHPNGSIEIPEGSGGDVIDQKTGGRIDNGQFIGRTHSGYQKTHVCRLQFQQGGRIRIQGSHTHVGLLSNDLSKEEQTEKSRYDLIQFHFH
jgi:hypothetical protein